MRALGRDDLKSRARPQMREDAVQMALMRFLDVLAMPGAVFWHCPNGGSRGRGEAGRFQALGVKAGIPDVLILYRGHLYGLELKADAGRVSPEQKSMADALGAAGATVSVAFGLDAALAQLTAWGVMRSAGGAKQAAGKHANG